jgi:hypothetical protein
MTNRLVCRLDDDSSEPQSRPPQSLRRGRPKTAARATGHLLGLRRVHGIAQMRDTHAGDDFRIPEDDRCVREVVEQPHSGA